VRRSEWVLAAYFIYTSVLALTLPVRPPVPAITVTLNLAVLACYALLIAAHGLRGNRLLGILRDLLPLPLMLLGYREMGWFAPSHHHYYWEQIWVVWDRVLLRQWGLKAAVESLGPVLPGLLEISYTLVYTIAPFSVAMLFASRKRGRLDAFYFTALLGVLLAYAQFPFWPSEPPRTIFPGEDLPTYFTVFRQFNWWLLGGYGIHTSVFPSAHVSGAFSASFAMVRLIPEKPWLGRFLLVLAASIATATVYGRYHYAADAVAGLAIAVAAEAAGRVTYRAARA
jgi:membrane-associated phospholipid phosphatase